MSSQVNISHGHRGSQVIEAHPSNPKELKQRFHHIKDDLRDRSDFEVTNGFVLSVLFDLYWIHHERADSAPSMVGPPVAADGGEPQ